MKKLIFVVALFLMAQGLMAQEDHPFRIQGLDTMRNRGWQLPDSMNHLVRWHSLNYRLPKVKARRMVTMTSIVVVEDAKFVNRRVDVFGDNRFHVGKRLVIFNGQAWKNSPFPDAYLDARTLSMPLP